MKVLVAAPLYAPEIGGPATHIKILEEAFPKWEIEIVAYPFARVRRFPKIFRHFIYMCGLMRRMRGVSVVYALDPVSVGLPALLAAKVCGKPFVLRVGGDYAWEQATQRFGVTMFLDEFVRKPEEQPRAVRMLVRIEQFVARHADEVIVPSEYLKRVVVAWGVSVAKLTTVYNAFDRFGTDEDKDAIRSDLRYQGFVIASAGRFVPWKGFMTLIELIAQLRSGGVDAMGVIIGDGPEEEALRARAEKSGIIDHIHFPGRLSHEELARAIKGADIFVLNTGYEGFSHQLLEVMALGIPVVTTSVGGNGELIEHEKTGLLVPYDDKEALLAAVRRLKERPEEAQAFVRAAHARALSFTTEQLVEGVATVLKRHARL